MASDGPLPDLPQLAAMTGTLEMSEWLSVFKTQTDAITDKDNYIERARGAYSLNAIAWPNCSPTTELRLAQVPTLNLRIADLEYELSVARADHAVARREVQELDQMLLYGRRLLRHTRPLIKPLRRARRLLRR